MHTTQRKRYRIQFPRTETHNIDQDEISFFLVENGNKKRIRFHDYTTKSINALACMSSSSMTASNAILQRKS